jgi:predicted Zn-dependent protease
LRASQDYVREVVAHEVGHVLGLRHNFAGSVSAER